MRGASVVALGHPRLTGRQREVLEQIANGLTNYEIAMALGVTEETVKSHARKVLALLRARSRAHAVAIGFELGVLSTTSPRPRSSRSRSSPYESASGPSA